MSKMIQCPTCKKMIAIDAATCPKCGHTLTDEERDKAIKRAKSGRNGCLATIVLVIVIGLFVANSKKTDTPTVTPPAQQQAPAPAPAAPAAPTQPVPAKEIKKDKEFPYSKTQVIAAYDDVMQQLAGVRPLSAAKEEQGNSKYSDNRSYMLTPTAAVMLLINIGGENPYEVKAIAVEDGTKENRAMIALNAMTLLAAVTPGWTGDERGAVGKALGITGTFPSLGKTNTTSAKGLNFSFTNNGERGLTLSIRPE